MHAYIHKYTQTYIHTGQTYIHSITITVMTITTTYPLSKFLFEIVMYTRARSIKRSEHAQDATAKEMQQNACFNMTYAFQVWRQQKAFPRRQAYTLESPRQPGIVPQPRLPSPPISSSLTSFCHPKACLLYTSPSPRDRQKSRMPSSA